MRILQISSARSIGGAETHLVDLIKGLTNLKHEIFVALRDKTEWRARLSFLPPENFLYVPLLNSLDIASAWKIARFIRRHEIEIVHAHPGKDYLVASLAVRFAPQAKLVLTRHILFPLKPLQKFGLSNTAKAIAVSGAVEKNLRKTFSGEKILCIPNGIEIEKWSDVNHPRARETFRFRHNVPFDAFFVGTIGELKSEKGQEEFVLAAKIVLEKFPETYFVIVGRDHSSDKSFRLKLKELVKNLGIENRFLWLDWIDDTAEVLHTLDVFVSASHAESFGLVILEAMASACPVVATETEGAKELLKNNETGKLVPVKNPSKLAEAIGELLEAENLRQTFGKNAQARAKERFTLERMVKETERIYREVLADS